VGPFLGGFYFYVQTLQTMSQGCCMSNIRVFVPPVHEKKIFKIHPFYPFLHPNRCQPLDFCKLESPFAKDASYQIWLKSVQWFWRRSHLNKKFIPEPGWAVITTALHYPIVLLPYEDLTATHNGSCADDLYR